VNNMTDLKEQTEILVKLQSIDSGKKRISTMLSKVDEKIRELNVELYTSRSIVEQSENELDGLRKKYRELETELNMNAPRIEKSKEKLRAVKNNKEYQSLLKEIDEVKKQSSLMEDGMLECLEQIENSEGSAKQSETEFRSIEERIQQEKQEVSKETKKGKLELETLNGEWDQVAAGVAPQIMNTFDRVREKARGVAIAPAINAVCQACNMNIPPQMFNDLQRFESLTFCPSCQRIIYWKG
jgi:predicted  nucleic acid-binding Zn-ribbon protein